VAVDLASHSNASMVLVVTDSGETVAAIAKYRLSMPVVALVVPQVRVSEGFRWTVAVRGLQLVPSRVHEPQS
jgi:pyruvate kinase